jgi:Omp85 superfamily domain
LLKKSGILFLLLFPFTGWFTNSIYAQQPELADTSGLSHQKDVIDILKRIFKQDQKKIDSARARKKIQFSLIPIAGSVAGGGRAVATAFNAAFYTGSESTTSLSTITFSPWFTFDGKFVLPFKSLVWLPNDILLLKGDTRFMVYPQYTWGLGGNTDHDNKVLLEYNYLRFYQSFLKKAGRRIYFGGGYDLDYHFNASLEKDSATLPHIPLFEYGTEYRNNTTSSGPVINFLVDSRRNSLNPPGGVYFALDYRFNVEFLGSTFNWQSIYVDARKYFPFDKRRQNLLAIWSFYWDVTRGKTPYLDLPSIGWDYNNRSGRGFEQNRNRGRRLLYFESEYRRDISRNGFLGFVLFTNLHSVSEYQGNRLEYWHPAAGAGLRIKFNKISRTNIGFDLAMSKDFTGIYLSLGEAF